MKKKNYSDIKEFNILLNHTWLTDSLPMHLEQTVQGDRKKGNCG